MNKHLITRARALWIGLILTTVVALSWATTESVLAAPPPLPVAGITPTPTFTATPVPDGAAPAATPTPHVSVADPAITKRGEPSLALPGEQVTFVIEVTNLGQAAAVDVVVTDTVPDYLAIMDVTSTQGQVTIEGQLVTIEVGTIGSGYVVEIVIVTSVSPDAPVPLDLVNVAELSSPNGGDRTSPSVTIVVPDSHMPETGGQRPQYWQLSAIGLVIIVAVTLLQKELPHGQQDGGES